MNDEPRLNSYTQIIDLIFTDAQESIKVLDSRVNILNTQLSAVAGFSAALIKFAGDLPDQSILIQDSLPCYSCSVLKILSLLLLVASAGISLIGILQKRGGEDSIFSPNEQVEKCLELTEDEYKLLFIDQYEKNIRSLSILSAWKGQQLILSGTVFVIATFLSALNLILATVLK
ncbi:MAG: hypothetical protein DCF12_20290 [Snowella sp.]|nr:MAG: hypothetical protein DCF12_20290 [Snowella sp.]